MSDQATPNGTTRPHPSPSKRKLKVVRRRNGKHDWRFWSQVFWTLVCVWIGYEFVRFVGYYEGGASGTPPTRPPGVEAFLPISGLMGLRDWFINGVLNNIHPAATIILGLAIISSVLLKKSFCGWVCPVGFLSEAVGSAGRKVHRWKGKLPQVLDLPLRSVKYALLVFFLWAIFLQMPSNAIAMFIQSPYNRVSDIKMLRFFTHADAMTFYILGGLVVLGFLVSGFWCRYLCPYGALAGLVSFLSPYKITRTASACIDCDKCNKACPAHIPVAQLTRVRSDECNACMECINDCPSAEALHISLPKGRAKLSRRAVLIAVTGIFVVGIGFAQLTGHWQNSITPEEYSRRIRDINNPVYTHNRGQVPQEAEGE
jgi:polyferredoxin